MTQTGSGLLDGRDRRPWVVVAAVVTGVFVLAIAAQMRPPSQDGSVVAYPSTPAVACHVPATADKGGQVLTFDWHMVAETDRSTGSAILFVSGSDVLVCRVGRSDDGSLGTVSTSLSGGFAVDPARLTLDTGSEIKDGKLEIMTGRVPAGTTRVWVDVGDGTDQPAAVGNGYYLAWLTDPGTPVRIDAVDANAHLLQRLEDPDGIKFAN